MHDWSDKTFDWKNLYQAEREAGKIMERYGRVTMNSKEKFGSIRWNIDLFNGYLYDLTFPDYHYYHYPKWLRNFDIKYRPLGFLVPIIRFWQLKVIGVAFTSVCQKYPHLVKEIVCDADEEYLPDELRVIHDSMWTRIL